MDETPYSPDKLITSFPTANGILEVYQGNLYRHVVTDAPANTWKGRPSLFEQEEEVPDTEQED